MKGQTMVKQKNHEWQRTWHDRRGQPPPLPGRLSGREGWLAVGPTPQGSAGAMMHGDKGR